MITVADRRDAWVGLSSWLEMDYGASLGWHGHSHRERNGALLRVQGVVSASQCLTAPTLSETPVFVTYRGACPQFGVKC